MWNKLGEVWCRLMHEQPMWPIHGRYECRVCGRQYPVVWAGNGSGATGKPQLALVRQPSAVRAGGVLNTSGNPACGLRTC